MTYRELCLRLERAGIENAEWDAVLLLEHFCRVNPTLVRLTPEEDYPSPALEAAVQRREARYPLQYLLGEWTFYRQTYEVSPACLIPRSDTEILVEEAVRLLPRGAFFADLCTGSGCIAVSVLAERPDTRCVAVDKFPETLAMARRNGERQDVSDRMECVCADVLSPTYVSGELLDAILSNPPYIPTKDLEGLAPEVGAEPRAALDGGEDGLLFYRKILQMHGERLKPEGFFLFEVGYDQAEAVCRLGAQAGFSTCWILKDYGGNQRVVYLAREEKDAW